MNRAIGKLIQTDQTHQIPSALQTGKDSGMQLLDQALLEAVRLKDIDADEAYAYATDKKPFQRFVSNPEHFAKLDITSG